MDDYALGLLGLGDYSTRYYISELNRMYNEIHGDYSTCPFLMINADFQKINPFLPHSFKSLEGPLKDYISRLEEMNVNQILMPNITIHETIDYIYDDTSLFVHPLKETAKRLKIDGVKEFFVFGTSYTMTSEYLFSFMKERGINVITPDAEDVVWIDKLRTRIFAEKHTANEIITFHWILEKYLKVAPVVVSCTELSTVEIAEGGLYDMTKIQIEQAIKLID